MNLYEILHELMGLKPVTFLDLSFFMLMLYLFDLDHEGYENAVKKPLL